MSTEGILLDLMEIAGYSRKFRSSKSKIQPTGAKNSVFYMDPQEGGMESPPTLKKLPNGSGS